MYKGKLRLSKTPKLQIDTLAYDFLKNIMDALLFMKRVNKIGLKELCG